MKEDIPENLPFNTINFRFRYSFICRGTSTRRQRSNFWGFRVKLPAPVTTSLTTQK